MKTAFLQYLTYIYLFVLLNTLEWGALKILIQRTVKLYNSIFVYLPNDVEIFEKPIGF